MSTIISTVTNISNIYSLIAFILLLVAFVLLELRIIEKRLFCGLTAVFIVSLLTISVWMIYQNQTKQGGQHQASPPVSQKPEQIAAATVKSPLPKQPHNEKEAQTAETVKKPAISKRDRGAATFKAEVHVTADYAGVVNISGGEGIVKLVQFCPDEWARGCDDNIIIKREGSSFALNKEGFTHHQTVFNFRDSSGKWLRIPHEEVTCGANVTCETGKGYFTYTGAAAKK